MPNLFINVASPQLGVPLKTFALGTFCGLIPLNIVHINTGMVLSDVDSLGGHSMKQLAILIGLGLLALLPTLFKKKLDNMETKIGGGKDQ